MTDNGQKDLFPPFSEPTTSLDAAKGLKTVSKLRLQVLRFVVDQPNGATCDEVEERLDMRHQTASARLWELENKYGLIIKTESRRKTRSGRNARVYQWAGEREAAL